jgi:hypothetical protein
MQECPYCSSARMTRYWLRDVGMYIKCDECLRELFDDGSIVATRYDLYARIKSLEDKLQIKESEIALLKLKHEMVCMQLKVLQDKVDEVYYAPGMPGYVQTQISFVQQASQVDR